MKSAQQLWLEQVGSVLETLNQGVIINNERKQIVFANSKFLEMIKVSADDLLGQSIVNFYPAEDVDCGIAVNPDGVRAMTEGAINFALTAALTGEITIKNGEVQQSNFNDYQVLWINQAPQVEVHIVPSTEPPSGVGELGATPLPAAVANAVFAATGVRVRRLPIDPQFLKQQRE